MQRWEVLPPKKNKGRDRTGNALGEAMAPVARLVDHESVNVFPHRT